MKKTFFFLSMLMVSIYACHKDPEPEPVLKRCPTLNDPLSLPGGSYGVWILLHEGTDGFSNDGAKLCQCTGWSINGTENGGVNNTYALKGFGGALKFRWKYGGLSEFEIESPWAGVTEKGIHLGDSLPTVLAAYPALQTVNPYSNVYQLAGPPAVEVTFDATNHLDHIRVTAQ